MVAARIDHCLGGYLGDWMVRKVSDKERLEEIKNSFLEGQHILFGTSWVSMPKESFDWLIKQVEKMEQLQQENEKEQKRLKNQIYKTAEEKFLLEKQLQQAQAKAERYKQALEEISNADWNLEGLDAERELDKVTDVAFKALEGEE